VPPPPPVAPTPATAHVLDFDEDDPEDEF